MTEQPPTGLREREIEILRLVATGASNKEIAQKLTISANTVKVHLRNIFNKIGVSSRTEAAMYAVRLGLTPAGGARVVEVATPPGEGVSLETASDVVPSRVQDAPGIPVSGLPRRMQRVRWWIIGGVFGFFLIFTVVYLGLIRPGMLAASPSTPDLPVVPRLRELTPMPTARRDLAVVVFENQVYAIAGDTRQGVTGVVERYDPDTDLWEERTTKPFPVSEVQAAAAGGWVYVPGGRLASGQPTDILEAYDPVQDRWEPRASLPAALCAYALVAYEGRVYLFGGWDGSQYKDTVYIYDPGKDAWSEGTRLSSPRAYAGAAMAGGKIYVMGGFNGKQILDANEVYSPIRQVTGDNPWGEVSKLPDKRYAMGMASVADVIVLIGGRSSLQGASVSRPLQYRPEEDQWQQIESLFPETWSNLGLLPLGTQMYVIGGEIAGELTSRNLVYQAIYTFSLPLIQ